MGLSGERRATRGCPPAVRIGPGEGGGAPLSFPSPSSPNWTRRGRLPPFLPFSLLLPPSPTPTRKGGSPTPGGSRTPPGAPPPWPAALPLILYIRGQGAPQDTQVDCLAVCGAPSTDFHLGHIVVVLRRSPASVTSSSPSPRRRADGTLPRPQLDQEYEGRRRAERVLNTEVPYVPYLIGADREGV